jgi:hypothetical protein
MKQTDLKTRVITFRVPETVWQRASERALLTGKSVNEWSRDEIAGRLDEHHGMSPGERLMMVEINNLRELIETLVLAEAGNTQGEHLQLLVESLEKSMDNREVAARDYFAQLAEVGAAGGHGEGSDAR